MIILLRRLLFLATSLLVLLFYKKQTNISMVINDAANIVHLPASMMSVCGVLLASWQVHGIAAIDHFILLPISTPPFPALPSLSSFFAVY
jgi:hypothetical protein